MTDELPEELKIAKELGITDLIPDLYKDLLQPATQELGKGLLVTARTVNIALAPFEGMIWGYAQIKSYLTVSLAKRLKNIPPEKIVRPKPNIAGPTIEGFKYSGHDPDLRELFANLLAASMNAEMSDKAHPAFVEIIKQLSPDEARILSFISQLKYYPEVSTAKVDLSWSGEPGNDDISNSFKYTCRGVELKSPNLIGSYFDNLRRLQLLEISHQYDDPLENSGYHIDDFESLRSALTSNKERLDILFVTELGILFVDLCIKPDFGLDSKTG